MRYLSKVGRNDKCPCGSGKKYKKCCLPKHSRSSVDARKAVRVIADLTTFQMVRLAKSESKLASEHSETVVRRAIAEVVDKETPTLELVGKDASEKLGQALRSLEGALVEVCSKHTTVYWLMLLRRMFVADMYTGQYRTTPLNIQATAELAAKKYGQPGFDDVTLVGGIEPSFQDTDFVAQYVGKHDFRDFILLCYLSMKYYYLTALYRRVGKGSRLVIRNRWEWTAEGSEELEFLISLYDSRMEQAESDLLSSLGLTYVVDWKELAPNPTNPMAVCMFGPQPVAARPSDLIPLLGSTTYAVFAGEMRFLPGYINLRQVEQVVSFSKADFLKVHGLPWEAFVSFLTGLTFDFVLRSEDNGWPFHLATLLKRGYILTAHSNLEAALGPLARQALKMYYPEIEYTDEDWDSYRNQFLDMAVVKPNRIDIHAMRPRSFIISLGESDLIDYSSIPAFIVEALRLRLSDDAKNSKAQIAEEVFEAALKEKTGLEPCYSRNKTFKDAAQKLGEADLSFRVGSVYIPIDIKAYLVTVEFDRGDYKAVNARWDYIKGWVAQADKLGQVLSEKPRGTNYDLLADGFTHVLPIVCSPFHEYIGSRDARYFLTDTIPRVATPAEIAAFLKSTDEATLKQHHCAFALRS